MFDRSSASESSDGNLLGYCDFPPVCLDAVQGGERVRREVTLATMGAHPDRYILDDEEASAMPVAPRDVT